ncbi:PLP-dependent aminotransferase family protein [Microbulbifer taiwanensis]|uniref:PLP-dependent aminotransferase family protein n=1 Tax=Microbulbifer taiwanensis TaxID=986746 RepID=A0ABW1YL08_9GAMM|nr:PLP-dependent aminotransferase family protein [Microbulbifer taiwanensis]
MKTTSGIPFSTIVFQENSDAPRYRQLYAYIRDLILDGSLQAGVHLPSSRELAAEIGVARNTVIAAYELLADEQFVDSAVGRGTLVRTLPHLKRSSAAPGTGSASTERAAPLRMGFALPDTEHFPSPAWERTLRGAQRQATAASARPPLAGIRRLRKLVCAYLGAYRGVHCREERVLITSGGQQGLYLAAQVLRQFSEQIYVEDPGYLDARRAFSACGFQLSPLPVDEQGVRLDGVLQSPDPGPRAICLTPSHQFPLGATLSLERRLQLLNWAGACDGWIVEDDYDAEYRYDGEPLTALAGLDGAQRVIYVGTFSKVLSPELRVGYVVVPEALLPQFRAAKAVSDGAGAVLMQNTVADFIQGGYFQAHLRETRALYRRKRDRFLQVLRDQQLPVAVKTPPNGMHVTLMLDDSQSDREVARQMVARGFEVLALSKHYLAAGASQQGLVVGFTSALGTDYEDFASNLAGVLHRGEDTNRHPGAGRQCPVQPGRNEF